MSDQLLLWFHVTHMYTHTHTLSLCLLICCCINSCLLSAPKPIWPCLRFSSGVLRHPESPKGQLAVPDLCPRHPAKVPVVSQEGGSHEADPKWNQVGPRQLCLVDSRGEDNIYLYTVFIFLFFFLNQIITFTLLVFDTILQYCVNL